MKPTGVDEEFEHENNRLTINKLRVESINGVAYGEIIVHLLFPKIKLSSTWVACGDSYTAPNTNWGPSWADYLASSTYTALINNAVNSTRTPYLIGGSGGSALSNDPVKNTAYATYTAIVMYEVNDINSAEELNNDVNGTMYLQMVLTTALTSSLPQNKIQDPRDSSCAKFGTWVNTSAYTFGIMFTTFDSFIAVRFTPIGGKQYDFEIYVNGTFYGRLKGSATASTSPVWTPISTIFDLGGDTPNCFVTIINKLQTSTNPKSEEFNDFVCAYTDADLVNARPVLFLSIPRYNYEYFSNATNEKRMLMNEAREVTARTCRLMGLPASFLIIVKHH